MSLVGTRPILQDELRQYELHHSPQYLVEKHRNILNIDRKTFLQIRYEGSRIDCSLLETKYGPEYLEKNEFRELISTLDKFIQHNS